MVEEEGYMKEIAELVEVEGYMCQNLLITYLSCVRDICEKVNQQSITTKIGPCLSVASFGWRVNTNLQSFKWEG